MIRHIAILGCGLVGSSWASFYASKGFPTRIYDADPLTRQHGAERATANLRALVGLDYLSAEEGEAAIGRLKVVDSLSDLCKDCDFVQESILEDYDTKTEVFKQLEEHLTPQAIVASSSSGLLMSRLQKAFKHPERSLIAHPFNPPHLIPLVELVPGEHTSESTIETVKAFFQSLGKRPVVLKKEVPGHIANRLAAAIWREALAIVDDGVASVEDVDTALCAGPGMRWALMGQHLIYELGGGERGYEGFMNSIGASFGEYWKDMQTWTEIPESAKVKAIEGTREMLEERSREDWAKWRDEKLVRLLQLLKD